MLEKVFHLFARYSNELSIQQTQSESYFSRDGEQHWTDWDCALDGEYISITKSNWRADGQQKNKPDLKKV